MKTLKKLYLKLRDGIPGTVWLVLIVALLAVMLSLKDRFLEEMTHLSFSSLAKAALTVSSSTSQ